VGPVGNEFIIHKIYLFISANVLAVLYCLVLSE
jgi:hypothetical protein